MMGLHTSSAGLAVGGAEATGLILLITCLTLALQVTLIQCPL